MKQLKEFKQGDLLFIWDACCSLFDRKFEGEFFSLKLILLGVPDVDLTKELAFTQLRELETMHKVIIDIGSYISSRGYAPHVWGTDERRHLMIARLKIAVEDYYDSGRKQGNRRNLVLGHEAQNRQGS